MEFKLSEINTLSNTTKAFVNKDETLMEVIGKDSTYYSIEKAIENKRSFSQDYRSTLAKCILSDYNFLLNSEEDILVKSNINLLLNSNTYTVSTGQQLHLFLGPVFVIYKILAVIKLTESLKSRHPDKNFVPIYWLASEDHDFEEIKDSNLFGHKFTWQTNQTGACGRFTLDEVKLLIENIRNQVNLNLDKQKLLDEFEEIYSNSKNLSEATIKLCHKMFGGLGLVCLDADKKELKNQFSNVIEKDILEQINFKPFNRLTEALISKNYHTQLHCREINFFYLHKGIRNRIILENGQYSVIGTDINFSREEITKDIQEHPERYSPNAVLRPLYQETILPNIAYIGGNAEINYWIQISNIFEINKINKPNLVLRPSLWIIPSKSLDLLKKLNISGLDLLISQNPEKHMVSLGANEINFKDNIDTFNKFKKDFQNSVNQIDKSDFIKLVELGKAYEKALKNAEKSMIEIEKNKVDNSLKKLEDTFSNYFDIKHMQERKLNCLEMWIKYENVAFTLKNSIDFNPSNGYIFSL
jgi:bacillithiol biosynthesis cysteine-adding enzyme BshC